VGSGVGQVGDWDKIGISLVGCFVRLGGTDVLALLMLVPLDGWDGLG
jgi:hypothetical protein